MYMFQMEFSTVFRSPQGVRLAFPTAKKLHCEADVKLSHWDGPGPAMMAGWIYPTNTGGQRFSDHFSNVEDVEASHYVDMFVATCSLSLYMMCISLFI